MHRAMFIALALFAAAGVSRAGVGDPQTKTDHPWYPGELSCSTWERLFKTQAQLYERVTGKKCRSDEDKVLASWYWRNLNYFHCTVGKEDVWDKGLAKGEPAREYWNGLFGYGFGLCFTTHHQWHGEMEKLLGPSRSRTCGVAGHTTFEVYVKGGSYGEGKWVLLDHDVSTVAYTKDNKQLAGLTEISRDMSLVKRGRSTNGWLVGGLHPGDPGTYKRFTYIGVATGYAAVPPTVNLRAGETLRRYLKPGLEDGKTWIYWGINYNRPGRVGPTRSRTWVNQPERLYKTKSDCGHRDGQGRYANAVYTYKPDFASDKYKEGVVDESDSHVTLEWYSPYVVAATPSAAAAAEQWGIYKKGCTGGLVIEGKMTCPVEVSTDQGKTWKQAPKTAAGMDLTDLAKGHHQYFLRFKAGVKALAGKGVTIRTVCQSSPCVVPRVKAGRNRVTYEPGGRAIISAGPNKAQAAAHVVSGSPTGRTVTLELEAPRKAKAVHVYGAARAASGVPPKPSKYNIDVSTDGGKTWKPVLKDWEIVSRPPEPGDWWSQTFLQGDAGLDRVAGPVRVRFANSGNVTYMRAEAHLAYEVPSTSPLTATFAWKEGGAVKKASHTYKVSTPGKADRSFSFRAGAKPETFWVEYAAE